MLETLQIDNKLGVDTSKQRQFRNYDDAMAFAKKLKMEKRNDWIDFCKGECKKTLGLRPSDIPAAPNLVYKNEWEGWWCFLGFKKDRFLKYKTAKTFVRKLKLRSIIEWHQYASGGFQKTLGVRPKDIPSQPTMVYKDEWESWKTFLGYDKDKYVKYQEAKKLAQSLGLKSRREWWSYCKGELKLLELKPLDIPSQPHQKYKDRWEGWGGFLGNKKKGKKRFEH
jgi:hypothetical protein